VHVLDMAMELGTPGYWNNPLKVPEAVTDTITTQ
jgi:hypothetical protein